eukprot:scaffold13598_cov54-Phaeocystis_antarctica.AAC.3
MAYSPQSAATANRCPQEASIRPTYERPQDWDLAPSRWASAPERKKQRRNLGLPLCEWGAASGLAPKPDSEVAESLQEPYVIEAAALCDRGCNPV